MRRPTVQPVFTTTAPLPADSPHAESRRPITPFVGLWIHRQRLDERKEERTSAAFGLRVAGAKRDQDSGIFCFTSSAAWCRSSTSARYNSCWRERSGTRSTAEGW